MRFPWGYTVTGSFASPSESTELCLSRVRDWLVSNGAVASRPTGSSVEFTMPLSKLTSSWAPLAVVDRGSVHVEQSGAGVGLRADFSTKRVFWLGTITWCAGGTWVGSWLPRGGLPLLVAGVVCIWIVQYTAAFMRSRRGATREIGGLLEHALRGLDEPVSPRGAV